MQPDFPDAFTPYIDHLIDPWTAWPAALSIALPATMPILSCGQDIELKEIAVRNLCAFAWLLCFPLLPAVFPRKFRLTQQS